MVPINTAKEDREPAFGERKSHLIFLLLAKPEGLIPDGLYRDRVNI